MVPSLAVIITLLYCAQSSASTASRKPFAHGRHLRDLLHHQLSFVVSLPWCKRRFPSGALPNNQGASLALLHMVFSLVGVSYMGQTQREQGYLTALLWQMWRPLHSVVEESPLGFIDASSLDSKDLHVHRIEFPGRTGYNYSVSPNPNHRWVEFLVPICLIQMEV